MAWAWLKLDPPNRAARPRSTPCLGGWAWGSEREVEEWQWPKGSCVPPELHHTSGKQGSERDTPSALIDSGWVGNE